uniref:BLE1 protein n=1 Tax=Solanum tuberosum TaxID=4113 RepID=M1AGC4_SOLTU
MAFPRMPPAQHYKTIFLCPVKNPEPHDDTQFFSCYIVSMLRLMYGDAFEGYAMSVSTSHLIFSSLRSQKKIL